MESAFLVVRTREPPLPAHVEDLLRDPSPGCLHFRAGRSRAWADEGGRVRVSVWQEASGAGPTAWTFDASSRLGFVVGTLRRADEPWRRREHWPQLALQALDRPGRWSSAPRFEGVFAAGALDPSGRGFVVADCLGRRNVYLGARGGRFAVGSRAELVARALAEAEERPPLDAWAVPWLAYTVWPAEGRSGFRDVSLLPPGARVELGGNDAEPRIVTAVGPPWGETAVPTSTESAARRVERSIRRHLEGLDEAFPGSLLAVDVTGGKDSRLVVAIAGARGSAEGLVFRTVGSDELEDVVIARAVAAELGLTWESGLFFEPPPPSSFEERFLRFVAVTGGMVNAWNLVQPAGRRLGIVRISGLGGECLRTYQPVERCIESDAELRALSRTTLRFGRARLLRDDRLEELERCQQRSLTDDPFGFTHPLDKLESYLIRTRARARYGPLDELAGLTVTARILPLYTTEAIATSFGLGPRARQDERLHHEIIRARSRALAEIPFAGPGWPDALAVPHRRLAGRDAERSPGPKAATFMQVVRRRQAHDAVQLMGDLFAEAGNDAWEHLDRDRAIEALRSYADLGVRRQRELWGAATAVAWLGGHALER